MKLPPKGRSVSATVSRTGSPAGVDHVRASIPSAPAFETAAASPGTADIGAWTIGCSIPSVWHTGVRTSTTCPSTKTKPTTVLLVVRRRHRPLLPVPPVERRVVALVPGFAQARLAQVPVGSDLGRGGAQ